MRVANIAAAARGLAWIRVMQNKDGGWAAFDRTVDRPILEYVPFADHNAMQDPSCPDITGRVLECLSWMGLTNADPTVRQAIDYVKREQEPCRKARRTKLSLRLCSQNSLRGGCSACSPTATHR